VVDGRKASVRVLFATLLIVTGCRGSEPLSDAAAEAEYRAAIEDARAAEPSEVVTTLTPLLPHNDDLVWRTTADSTRQVLVVTWGGSETVPAATAGDTITAEDDVWVTAAPALQEFCRSLDRSGDARTLRLAQRLGLPPDAGYTQFVELWVRPGNLVRPCPDPEVSDRECELNAPVPADQVRISTEHREWFRTLKRTSHSPDGYPFTGLGYTYDWHPETDEVGLSEFVLRPGESATVRARHSTRAYCQ
jgi:hypothetical protein